VAVSGNYAYVAARLSDALTVVDVTNPASPSVAGQVINGTNLNGAMGVAVSGNYAYLAAYRSDALTVVDVTNPASPSVAGQVINGTNLNGAWGVAVSGNYAYVAVISAGLTVVDVTAPSNSPSNSPTSSSSDSEDWGSGLALAGIIIWSASGVAVVVLGVLLGVFYCKSPPAVA